MILKLITDKLSVYFSANNSLISQEGAVFSAPAGKYTTVCFFENCDFLDSHPAIVTDTIAKGIGVVLVCSRLPTHPVISPFLTYIVSGWEFLVPRLFQNPLKFKAILYHFKLEIVAKQFANLTNFKIPIVKDVQELNSITDEQVDSNNLLVEVKGGLGDHLLTLPTLKTLAKQGKKISVCVLPKRKEIYNNLPYIEKVYTDPKQIDIVKYDKIKVIDFGAILTNYSYDISKQHRVFAIAEFCSVWKNQLITWVPDIKLTDAELKFGQDTVKEKKSIFLGWDADRTQACMPLDYANDLVDKFVKKGYTIYTATLKDKKLDNCINLKLTVRQLFSVINAVDTVITVDTSFLHIAGALNKKTILLPTTISPEWRAATYYNCIWVEPTVKCFPCMALQKYAPDERLCNKSHKLDCLYSINQDKIIKLLCKK